MCEPDSREPWFICASHDESCLADTLKAFEEAVDVTLDEAQHGGAHAKMWNATQGDMGEKRAAVAAGAAAE